MTPLLRFLLLLRLSAKEQRKADSGARSRNNNKKSLSIFYSLYPFVSGPRNESGGRDRSRPPDRGPSTSCRLATLLVQPRGASPREVKACLTSSTKS